MLRNPFKRMNKPVGAGRQVNRGKCSVNFRCRESGSYPVDYEFTKFMINVMEKIDKDISHKIQSGMVDEYTTPDVFDEYIEAHLQLMRNDIEKQALRHGLSIGAIEEEIHTALSMNKAYKLLGEETLLEHEGNTSEEREEDHYEK